MTVAATDTPTVRGAVRRSRFWIIAAVFMLLVAFISFAWAGGGTSTGIPLDARDAAPAGSKALVEVIRQQRVTVTVVDTLVQAEAAAEADSTVLLYDPSAYLTEKQRADVATLGTRTVVVQPDFNTLVAVAPGLALAGVPSSNKPVDADCTLPAAVKANSITSGGQTYRITANKHGGPDKTRGAGQWSACFPSSGDAWSLLVHAEADHTLSILGNSEVLANETIIQSGNAALALNLLGSSDSLIWYLPTLADVAPTGAPSLGDLSPDWLPPVLALLALAAAAAAGWRGRRLGPLVVENLPVIVKASETMEGRARLYERASTRAHALDSVRIGTVSRLANRLGMSRHATVWEVADAVAKRTGRDAGEVRGVLLDRIPASDSDLMRLSDALLLLESETAETVEGHIVEGHDR